jgi:beta-glucosidase
MEENNMRVKKNLMRGGAYLMASLIFVGMTARTALETNRNVVDGFLGTKSYYVETDTSSGELYTTFTADYTNTSDLVAAHETMGEQLMEEGAVLLKNNGALPLGDSKRNVTLLGIRADAKTLYGATIGVNVPAEQNVSLTMALEEKGFSVNTTMNSVYETLVQEDAFSKDVNKVSASFSGVLPGQEAQYVGAEPTANDFARANSGYMSSIAQYNDAAIVVVGRPGTEAGDYYPGETGVDTSQARNALALTKDELAVINFAKENFDTVIVLINAVNAMELGDLETDDGVDAVLWIGFPGNYGMRGVVDILSGESNPSGALPDIYASDSTSSPAMANYGVLAWSNASQYLDTAVDRGDFYLIEAEGIYTGYRYYETRYADLVMGQGNADSTVGTFDSTGAWNYSEEVIYPFGYGLSYTTFEQTLDSVDVSISDESVVAKVTVTNTGTVAGKTSVQLYAQAPYIKGGIEKSAIQLLDYTKTDVINPGESVTVTIEADLQNITSYDEDDSESYVLDKGDYYFSVGNGSHEALNNILAAQGYSTSNGMDASGNADNVQIWTNGSLDKDTFGTGADGQNIANHLQEADYNTWNEGTVTYLSRSDWEGTWPRTYSDLELTEAMLPYLTNDFYTIATGDDTSSVTFGADNGLTFSNVKGLDYDDELWDDLLDQLDLQEAINFITQGNRNYASMDSIGFVGGQYTENGPNGFNVTYASYSDSNSPWYVSEDDENANYKASDIGCAPLVAATFNKDFVYAYGELWGNDSLFNGLPILWGPGLNLHRTPYNGRNVEYYSEDPVLAGYTGINLIQGGLSKGLIMASKHFAFNDQEANRNGVAPFMNEQKARELELRSFQIAVEGGALALMTSFSRIGPTYVGASTGLITDILYNEWGFHGYVVSDMVNPGTYMTWKESVIAGTTNFDTTEMDSSWASYITADTNNLSGDVTMLTAIRNDVHNSLYAFAQSNLMNKVNESSKKVEANVWWRVAYKCVIYGASVLTIIFVLGYVLAMANKKKGDASNE